MEYVPTLCALGTTTGAGVTGLTLGCEDAETAPRPASRKRKAPGLGGPFRSFSSPLMGTARPESRDVVQQLPYSAGPKPAVPRDGHVQDSSTRPGFWRRMSQGSSQTQNATPALSRQSSVGGRRSLMLSTPEEHGSTGDNGKIDSAKTASSWLRRISTMSSMNDSPPSSLRPATPSVSVSNTSGTPFLPLSEGPQPLHRNRLVKRTTSQRAMSASHAQVMLLRRPATSHQRSATYGPTGHGDLVQSQPPAVQDQHPDTTASVGNEEASPLWRPYFTSGYGKSALGHSRKRHTSYSAQRAQLIKPLQPKANWPPTLLSARFIEGRPSEDSLDDIESGLRSKSPVLPEENSALQTSKKRSSLRGKTSRLGRKRNVTDPSVYHPQPQSINAGRTTSHMHQPMASTSPLSPISHVSTFDVDLPRGTPSFPSTPFLETGSQSSSARRPSTSQLGYLSRTKRVSLAPSASTTFGSDNETRIFSSGDEDSMDFQSDTAYDSLATRATASSHSGLKGPGIETIFDESPPSEKSKDLVALHDLMDRGSLDGLAISLEQIQGQDDEMHDFNEREMQDVHAHQVSTPEKHPDEIDDDYMATPVPRRNGQISSNVQSSPPSVLRPVNPQLDNEEVRKSIEAMSLDDDSDWDRGTEGGSTFEEEWREPEIPKYSSRHVSAHPFDMQHESFLDPVYERGNGDKRLSIFDWSEQQNGNSPRPKTVHGKQGAESRGSRPSGRRGPSGVHLRSQSVPVTRESLMENDPCYPATKFGTWGLGNKGVSEEWNDDFEFDEGDEAEIEQSDHTSLTSTNQQGMKVPQAIIDRQASVHGQFGQVQEFMHLVEELKRLRLQGQALHILEDDSRSCWKEAENIINLATLNDEDDELRPPQSPISPYGFEDFDEMTPLPSRIRQDSEGPGEENGTLEPSSRRSTLNAATPPSSRPRGESLAQAKSFLQTIHQHRVGPDSSPAEIEIYQQKKLPFDTRDLRDLVNRANNVTRALKELVRRAQGVSVSPERTPKKFYDPPFSHIFNRSDESPSPTFKKPGLPKSRSAQSYLGTSLGGSNTQTNISGHMKMMTVV